MKANKEDIEQFDAFLRGQMTKEEILLFESKLATDSEMEEEFGLHEMIIAGIAQEKEARFRKVLAGQREDTFIGKNTWGKKFTIASAAIVLIGMLLLVLAQYKEYNPTKGNNSIAKADETKKIAENGNNQEAASTEDLAKDDKVEKKEKEKQQIEPNEELVQESKETELDVEEDFTKNEKALDLVAVPEVNATGDDEVEVRKDKLESEQVIKVQSVVTTVAGSTRVTSMNEVAIESKRGKKLDANANVTADKPIDSLSNSKYYKKERIVSDSGIQVRVQYFKSPLNYKGYQYNKRKKLVRVYGMKQNTSTLKELNGVLYLKNGEDYYVLVPNSDFSPLLLMSKKSIIDILNK